MEDLTREGLSRDCMRRGAALLKDDVAARTALAEVQTRIDACAPDDQATLATLAKALEECATPPSTARRAR